MASGTLRATSIQAAEDRLSASIRDTFVGAKLSTDGDSQNRPAQCAVDGEQVAFVGLPAQGLLCGELIQSGFLLLGNTPAETAFADKVSRLVFHHMGVASHQEDFCFEPFVFGDLVGHQRCAERAQRLQLLRRINLLGM